MASTQLNDTQGTPTNAIKYTLSMWAKRSNEGADSNYLASVWVDGTNHWCMRFITNQLDIYDNISGSTTTELKTTRKFRDPAAWYHIVYVYDSANVTAGDRQKIYVNGVEETSFAIDTNPGSSAASVLNVSGRVLTFGARNNASYFDGEMAHVHFCDGQAYAASDFGETDSTSGIWVAKTSPSVTYGNNGFFLKFASGASGTDSSGNSNDFAVTGTLTNLKDNPDNNFVTMNPLDNYFYNGTFTNSNTTITSQSGSGKSTFATGTFGDSAGKYYWEAKNTAGSSKYNDIGISTASSVSSGSDYLGSQSTGWGYQGIDGNKRNNGSSTSYGNTFDVGDIISVALDLDNNKLYFAKNGVWQNSGVPTSGSTGTGAISIASGTWRPAAGDGYNQAVTWQFNFGNGIFGTTSVTSAGTNASGNGTFEYDVPTGYTALCTKGINS